MSMRYLIHLIIFLTLVFATSWAQANWTQVTGPVSQVITLGDGFIVTLRNQPITGCPYNDGFSVSSASVPSEEARKNILAVALIAQAKGKRLQIWYDETTCDQIWQRPTTNEFIILSD